MPNERAWVGRSRLAPGMLLYAGVLPALRPHAHLSTHVLASFGSGLEITGEDGQPHSCRAVVVPSMARHAIHSGAANGLVVHVDPSVWAVRGPTTDSPREWIEAGEALMEDVWAEGDPWQAALVLAGRLAARPAPARMHPALADAIRLVGQRLEDGPLRLADVAAEVGLSPSRLSHLFRAQTGLPFRAYVRWQRLWRAASASAEGASITDAAHRAGFADGAHLSRVCMRTFGLAPSDFAGHARAH